jgi:hypothetical protein
VKHIERNEQSSKDAKKVDKQRNEETTKSKEGIE